MDGFAVDYFANFCWEKGRAPTDAEMRSIGGVFTPATAPVINRLAAEFAVFTRWFCEVPSCTFRNRSFYHGGTSLGKIDNESVVSYAWDQEMPNLFGLLTGKGIDWRVYFDTSQTVARSTWPAWPQAAGSRRLGPLRGGGRGSRHLARVVTEQPGRIPQRPPGQLRQLADASSGPLVREQPGIRDIAPRRRALLTVRRIAPPHVNMPHASRHRQAATTRPPAGCGGSARN